MYNDTTPIKTETVNYGTIPSYTPTLTGWNFVEWSCKSGNIEYGQPITNDVEYSAWWQREFDNLLLSTSNLEPTATSSSPSTSSSYHIFPLATTDELALPTGGSVQVGGCFGLIQHDGSANNHHLSLVPAYLSSEYTDDEFTETVVPSETYTVLYDDRDNPSEETTVKTTVKLPMSRSKTDYSDWNGTWGNLAPMSDYGEWWEQWYSPETATYDMWYTLPRYSKVGSDSLIASETVLSAEVDFDKTSGTGSSVRTYEYDTSSHEVGTTDVPASINGHTVNRLAICLIKKTKGCTVAWRMHFYKLLLQLW